MRKKQVIRQLTDREQGTGRSRWILWLLLFLSPVTCSLSPIFAQNTAPSGTNLQPQLLMPNDGATGTTLALLAKINSSGNAIKIATTDNRTGVVAGVVTAGAGTTGSATIAQEGNANCVFDGATTIGDYVYASTTTAGDCTDKGANPLFDGSQLIGRVQSTNGAGGTYAVALMLAPPGAVGFGTITTNGTSVATVTSQSQPTITFTGLSTSARCVATISGAVPATWQTGIQLLCGVTANTVTVWESNPTAGAITPASITLNVAVF